MLGMLDILDMLAGCRLSIFLSSERGNVGGLARTRLARVGGSMNRYKVHTSFSGGGLVPILLIPISLPLVHVPSLLLTFQVAYSPVRRNSEKGGLHMTGLNRPPRTKTYEGEGMS